MLREYLNSAQDVLLAKKEIYDVKQQRLMLAEDEYNLLTALAASRSSCESFPVAPAERSLTDRIPSPLVSVCSSSSSINVRHDPELLKAELAIAKERVWRLKRELLQITSDITYTQRGVDTLNSVEQKLSAHENGCYNISEVQAIREEMMNVQRSLVSGEKVKDELLRSLAHIKSELTRQQYCDSATLDYTALMQQDRICVASQTDLCSDNMHSGARFAEMAKTKLQYGEWRKRIKQLQQQLADHVEKIEPGQLESDKDRLLLIQEKEQYLKELRSIPSSSKSPLEYTTIQEACRKLEVDLNNAYELSNQCIANRLKLHEEKQILLQQLQDALKSTKMLEERLKSFSSGSTFSISSGSSLGSLSTASSKNSLSALSFTDIYGDPLTADTQVDMIDLHRRSQRMSHPSEISLSPRSSLSVETPPASPMKENAADEPTYENMRYFTHVPSTSHQELDSTVFDCMRLEERLNELELKQTLNMSAAGGAPLSPIYEKPSLLNLPQESALSRASSASNTRSVSAAVSNESVAGDSGVFEASRAVLPGRESAQVQITLKYLKSEASLQMTVERARNLQALCLSSNCQVYLRAALLPNTQQSIRTSLVSADVLKPIFGDAFTVPIPLNKLFTKSLQVNVVNVVEKREEIIGCAQISLAEFNANESSQKWYNILSFRMMHNFDTLEVAGVCREESSDESTIISSQTSTLTRDQGHDGIPATLVEELEEKLKLDGNGNENDDEDDDEDDSSTTEDRQSTEQMLAAYISEVHNFASPSETVDKETNTECAFLPEKSRTRGIDRSSTSSILSNSSELAPIDERVVKRSQTFSPSAVVSKSRYVCRLNRSDSDSAMHFAAGHGLGGHGHLSMQNSFHRGAIERRSLRFHSKVLKTVSSSEYIIECPEVPFYPFSQ